ncbi:hypothetical protein CKO35_14740 [Ectothiorhodospira shaposhnikovii]|nr:hypothetical protein [Ectothiorhodospira shaposhnikovii]
MIFLGESLVLEHVETRQNPDHLQLFAGFRSNLWACSDGNDCDSRMCRALGETPHLTDITYIRLL